ncbi:hypothetical protein JRO89_XS08G0162900 [Xanthoceras sorbifolium]|uniref:Scarecrow-like protein 15 n=1 Tax=Xanthoceras sorbifolium TaxID=99658 RepID=A0ABQ8HQ91_9ROSI|nr:hypothetical protein JRO89_XS08G0162900 [Xanthoceras sorbifolium]
MRVPVQPPQIDQSSNPKLPVASSCNVNNSSNVNVAPSIGLGGSCYEPTSVLELRGSPSPIPEKPATATEVSAAVGSELPSVVEWDEHALRNMDWDSIMRDLGLDDDSALNSLKGDTYSNQNNQSFSNNAFDHMSNASGNCNVGLDLVDELIRAADCVDSNELSLAQMILARLNQRLRAPVGKPLQRAAFFFKEALNSVVYGLTRPTRLSSWSDIVQSIRAYKAFSGISPIPMFTHFTSNQALLESLDRDGSSSSSLIHIIDFDIGFGGQYASLMREIAEKAESCKMNPTSLRITAVVPDEYASETRLIKDNLIHFAQELKIRFHIDFVLVRIFELSSFKAVKFMEGEKTAVVLSPTIFRRLGSTNNAVAFVSDIRFLSPSVVVFVDSEGSAESGATGSFKRNFVNSLEHYSMMFESLDAAIGGGDWPRKIEMSLLRPRILAAVEGAGRRVAPWREVFSGAGLRPVKLSQFADFQAECLLGKVQVGGFQVAKRQAELVLCWHQWALVATSAWSCSVGIGLPVYSTFKAIERKNEEDQQKWLMYWAAYGSFSIVEVFSDKLISWFPMYYHVKFAFLVWLQLPSVDGSKQLYRNHLRPFLLRHQARVDQVVGLAYGEMVCYLCETRQHAPSGNSICEDYAQEDNWDRGTIKPDQPGGLNAIEGPPTTISDVESDHED